MKTKKSFPYIALYITAIAAGSLVSFLFKFFTDNPYNFWNVVVPSAIAVGKKEKSKVKECISFIPIEYFGVTLRYRC